MNKWPGDTSAIADESTIDVICKIEPTDGFGHQSRDIYCINEAATKLENEFKEHKSLRERGGNSKTADSETEPNSTSSMVKEKSTDIHSREANIKSIWLSDETCSTSKLKLSGRKNLLGSQVHNETGVKLVRGQDLQELEVGTKVETMESVQPCDGICGESEVGARTETGLVDDNDLPESEAGMEMVKQSDIKCGNEAEVTVMESENLQVSEAEEGSTLQEQFSELSCEEEEEAPKMLVEGNSQAETEMVSSSSSSSNVKSSGLCEEKQQLSLNEKLHKTCEVM